MHGDRCSLGFAEFLRRLSTRQSSQFEFLKFMDVHWSRHFSAFIHKAATTKTQGTMAARKLRTLCHVTWKLSAEESTAEMSALKFQCD
jgi:hypothetical protein